MRGVGEGGEVRGRGALFGLLVAYVFLSLACTTRPAGTPDRPTAPADTSDAAEPDLGSPALRGQVEGAAGAEASCPELAVAGFPFPIRLVFGGGAEVPMSTGLFEEDNPFSIKLRPVAGRDGATYVFPVRASRRALLGPVRGRRPRRDGRRGIRKPGRPTFALPEGRTCEIVLDLSGLVCLLEKDGDTELCRFRRLAPGAYGLEISHPSVEFRAPARPVAFSAPSAEEHRLLARLNNLGPVGSIWKAFVVLFPELTGGVDLAAFRPEARAQLGYCLMLVRLVHSEKPVAELEITDEEVAALLPAYRTAALLLRYEMELARGDGKAAGRTREAILAARPYAVKALEGIVERGGAITGLRRTIGIRADTE